MESHEEGLGDTIVDVLCSEGFTSINRVCKMDSTDFAVCKLTLGDQKELTEAISKLDHA